MCTLRLATREIHERTDAAVRSGDWLSSPSAYASFLTRTLRFHRLVETGAGQHLAGIAGLDYQQRRRSPLLEEDLRRLAAFGVQPSESDQQSANADSLHINQPGAALGCLYVVEGSTLGGTMIARWIARRLGYGPGSGASSFAPYGTSVASRWRTFGAVLDAWALSAPADLPSMVAAARATFAAHQSIVINGKQPASAVHA